MFLKEYNNCKFFPERSVQSYGFVQIQRDPVGTACKKWQSCQIKKVF